MQASSYSDRSNTSSKYCVFCGGSEIATTEEHCPPRALFLDKQWPEGFIFPACNNCNHGSRDEDLLIAFISRSDPFLDRGDSDGRMVGLIARIEKRFPNLLSAMRPSPSEARRMNRELGISPLPGFTHQDVAVWKITPEIRHAVRTFASKLAKGIFFKETGEIFSSSGQLALYWFTNTELIEHGAYRQLEQMKHIFTNVPVVQRNRKTLNDQFEYAWAVNQSGSLFMISAVFRHSFGIVVFGSTIANYMQNMIDSMGDKYGESEAFTLLS